MNQLLSLSEGVFGHIYTELHEFWSTLVVKEFLFGSIAIVFCLCYSNLWAEDYLIGPGDVLGISVYDNEDLTTKVRVSTAGTIVMPLIGQIEVEGGTVNTITDKITQMLADGYLVNPQVNIFVEEYRSKKVVVLGNVRTPGLIELNGSTNFLELVSKAGGLEKDAGDTATIQRKNKEGTATVIVVDLLALIERGDLSQNIQIRDDDTVFISKAGMCFITGQVKSPGTYSCGDGTTVLRLVALAGGFTGKASKSSISIVRIVNNEKKVSEDVDLYVALQDNDVVVVPEIFF
jgi:polysaccharide export outer membrane protein